MASWYADISSYGTLPIDVHVDTGLMNSLSSFPILGMNPLEGGRQELVADIPLASLIGYSTDLRSMTGGSGEFSYEFSRYEQMPADAQEKVLKEAAAEKENIK